MGKNWMARAAVAALLAGAAFAAQPAAAEGVTIGQFTALTGASTVVGLDQKRGVEIAAKRINEGYAVPTMDGNRREIGPGLLGGPVTVVVEDSESRPAAAMDAVRKLVTVDNVPVVLGEYSSGRTLPTGQFTNENGIVQISTGANSPMLRDIGPFFFNMIGLVTKEGEPMVDLAQADIGAKSFATLVPNNPFGVGLEFAICETAEARGLACLSKIRYEENKSDYRAELRQLVAGEPDAVVFFAYGTESRLILRQAYELGLGAGEKWYGPEMSNWAIEVKDTPEVAEGIKGIVLAVGGDFYETEYAETYREMYGEEPLTGFGAFAYDAMMVAALAIDNAGSADADAIRQALPAAAAEYRGLTGDKSVDEYGMQVTEDYEIRIFKDGKLQPYTPGE